MFGGLQTPVGAGVQPASTQVSQPTTVPKFMVAQDEKTTDSKDLVKEVTKVVEDSIS